MNCEAAKEWLGPYLDGEAPPDVRQAVEAHVAACAHCAQELDSWRAVGASIASPTPVCVPSDLWASIERRLAEQPAPPLWHRRPAGADTGETPVPHPKVRRLLAAAAVLLVAVGLVGLAYWGGGGASPAEAATVNFEQLLDGLKTDAGAAFERFLKEYRARPVSVAEAKRYGAALNFDIPETLPGGFHRAAVYTLRFGKNPGVAARYLRDGELLGVVFHPPILQEHYGTHEDRSCIVGQHRGHAVGVGDWTLAHLTDPTTCHCVLSKLDQDTELPAVMAAIAPGMHGPALDDSPHGRHP